MKAEFWLSTFRHAVGLNYYLFSSINKNKKMCSLPLFTNPWISTNNPSADKAAIVTVLTNPAPLGIQTFYKMYIYIYIYSYIHISNIFVAVYALNARGSVRNI